MQQNGVHHSWIGARDMDKNDTIKFVQSGAMVPLGLWDDLQPKHIDGDCVWVNNPNDPLLAENCENAMTFVCEVFSPNG